MVNKKETFSLLMVTILVLGCVIPLFALPAGADEQARTISRTSSETEPNQDYNQANEIFPGDHVTGILNWSDRHDVFKVNVTAGRVFNVTLTQIEFNAGQTWEYNLDYEIIKPRPDPWIVSGHWWQEKQVDGGSILVYETGYHYVWVYANGTPGGDTTLETNYVLSVNEFNATIVGTGSQGGSIDADNDSYIDGWYKLTTAADQGIRAALTNPPNGDFDIYLYNWWPYQTGYKDGTSTPFVVNASWERSTNNVEAIEGVAWEGTLFVKVQGYSGNGAYSLDISEVSRVGDGDSTADTATVIDHSEITLSSFQQSDDMFDWYKVTLDQGEHLNVTVDLMSGQGLMVFYVSIYDQWKQPVKGGSGNDLGVYDTVNGYGYTGSNSVDNEASLILVPYSNGVASTSEWYITIRAVFKLWESGETNFFPADAMYRMTWDLPNYGPDSNGSIPDIVMDEDTSSTDLNLYDYFIDNEGDPMTFSTSPSTIPNVTVSIDQGTGDVNITPFADYNTGGDPINITFKGTDPAADWGNKFSTQNTTLSIKAVNDAPRVLIPFDPYMNISEDTAALSNPAELDKVFYDIDGDKLLYRASGNNNIPVFINQTTSKMTIGPAVQWFGSENITVTAEDPSGLKVTSSFEVEVIHENHPPTGIGGIIAYTHNITEDLSDNRLNVASIFEDIDVSYADDELTYFIDYPLGYSPPFHMDVEIDANDFLSIVPEVNFSGQEEIPLFARDKSGAKVMVVVTIDVKNVNDPPEIRGVSPTSNEIKLEEGENRKFELTETFDIDGDYLKFKWFINNEHQILVPALQAYFEFETDFVKGPGKYSSGNYTLEAWVSDDTVNVSFVWNIEVVDVNRKPTNVRITEPVANQKFEAGTKVTLRAAVANDLDGDTLTYKWTDADGKLLGTEESGLYNAKKVGTHKITLTVSDGKGGETTASVTIKVTEATGSGGLFSGIMLYALIGIILVVVILLLVMLVIKKRGHKKEPETAKDVADSYEAQMWGPKTTTTPPAEQPPTEAPPTEQPPADAPAPEPTPAPTPSPEEPAPKTWSPGAPSEPPTEQPAKPGPPSPGPPQ